MLQKLKYYINYISFCMNSVKLEEYIGKFSKGNLNVLRNEKLDIPNYDIKLNISYIGMPAIYILVDNSDKMYVGCSDNIYQRIKFHIWAVKKKRYNIENIRCFYILFLSSRIYNKIIESHLIRELQPELNRHLLMRKNLTKKEKDEDTLINYLIENEGETLQSKMVLNFKSHFLESKISRLISDMEEKGLIEKIRYGMSNKIRIIE